MKRDLKSMGKKAEPVEDIKKEEVKRKAEELSHLSEGELMEELFKSVDEAKAQGDLNDAQMDSFLKTVSPMLTPAQREKMEGLIDKLR